MSTTAHEERAEALIASLERRFVTALDRVTLGARHFDLLRPRSADDLISEDDFARDERLPYWADLWPSAVRLAERMLEDEHGGRLLELGCGLGLVATAAMCAGWTVLATDYYEDALRFTRANVWRNEVREAKTRLVDWRALPDDLGRFDRVVASDVLYEKPYASLVASVLLRTIAEDGDALIADPGRVVAPDFLIECERIGLTIAERDVRPLRLGTISQTITIYRIRHSR